MANRHPVVLLGNMRDFIVCEAIDIDDQVIDMFRADCDYIQHPAP